MGNALPPRRRLRAALVVAASLAAAAGPSPSSAQEPPPPVDARGIPDAAPAGPAFYPTMTYAGDPAFRPRPADAAFEDACDRDDPRDVDPRAVDPRAVDPRCRDVDVERSSSMRSPALVVVGGTLTVVGALGIAGGVALLNHESSGSGAETSLDCNAGTRNGVECEPTVDTSGVEDALFTVAGVGTLVLSGAVAVGGVALVVIGAVPKEDEAPSPHASFSLAPSRVTFDATF